MKEKLAVVILAAGQGTRMKSEKPKVLHELMGKTLIRYVLDAVLPLQPEKINVIVGYQGGEVRKELQDYCVSFAVQKQQLGTGHALQQAQAELDGFDGPVLVLCGDTPLLCTETLEDLVDCHLSLNPRATVLTAKVDNPGGYGRVIRSEDGKQIRKIAEQKDLDPAEETIKEINSGTYVFQSPEVFSVLKKLNTDNKQGEYYLTDVVRIWTEKGKNVFPFTADDYREIQGINDRVDLSRAGLFLREKINREHQKNGVTIEDPAHTYIEAGVVIAPDAVIRPGTVLQGNTEVGGNVVLGPHTTLIDTRVGSGSSILKSHVQEADIGPDCSVGPYAHLRPGTVLDRGVRVGDFVEIKKSFIGEGSKSPHLAYVGDATLGPDCNIGAGTIFANYDGQKKNPTFLGREVFIGSNSTLVAPLRMGDCSRTGAGSVVTRDVGENITVVGVPARPFSPKNE